MLRTTTRVALRWFSLGLLQLCGCAPIGEPHAHGPNATSGAGSVTTSRAADTQGMSIASDRGVQLKAACTTPDARACSADKDKGGASVLVCRDGSWTSDVTCDEGEGCVTDAQGAGRCEPVLSECAAREPGDLYCDAEAKRRVCLSASTSRASDCGEREHCVVIAGKAQCRCVAGAVLRDSICEDATSCTVENGGCDALTTCMTTSNGRTCSECPPGYVGDGLTGCAPQLLSLTASCGALDPPLARNQYEYELRVPLACQALQLEATAPGASSITPNGAELPASKWSLTPVKVGDTAMPIVVTSQDGVPSKYKVTVERSGVQEAYIKSSNSDPEDRFGYTLQVAAGQLYAGSPWEDSSSSADPTNNDAANSGAVYMFGKTPNGWEQQLYLKASPVVAGSYFGSSIAVSGDMLLIGAPGADFLDWYGGSNVSVRAGAIYVFTRQNGAWVQEARLTPAEGSAGDMFGIRMVLSDDTLLVGAPGDAVSGAPRSGAAYIFKRDHGAWVEKQRLLPPAASSNASFGLSVAIGSDRLLVGAPNDSTRVRNGGCAYVFSRQGSGAERWELEQRLEPKSDTEDGTFGWHLAQHGDSLLISAPVVVRTGPAGKLYVFEHGSGTWTQTDSLAAVYPAMSDLYGASFFARDTTLIVGANGDSSGSKGIDADGSRTDAYQSGAVYLYTKSASNSWVASTYIKSNNPDGNDSFGESVALGDAGDDGIYVSAPFESGGSRKINGDVDNNSANLSGAVYVFR